jgi:hypothetical protein
VELVTRIEVVSEGLFEYPFSCFARSGAW